MLNPLVKLKIINDVVPFANVACSEGTVDIQNHIAFLDNFYHECEFYSFCFKTSNYMISLEEHINNQYDNHIG